MAPNSASRAGGNGEPIVLRLANAVGMLIDVVSMSIAIISICAMFLSLMAEVFVRYITHTGLGWPNEIPNILFPWLIMGCIVLAAQRGAHIAAEAIRTRLGNRSLRVILILIHLLVAVSFAYLAQLSLQVITITKNQVFPITGLGQAWAYSSMLFGFWGIAISAVVNLIRVAYATEPDTIPHSSPEHMT